MAKLHELDFESLLRPPYSPDLVPSDYWLFADLKKISKERNFARMKEIFAENNAHFEDKDKSFYTVDIEKLEKR